MILTAIAEVVAAEHSRKQLAELDSDIHQKQGLLEEMRGHLNEVERQLRIPDIEARIAALPPDIAEQVREAQKTFPGMMAKMREAEAETAGLVEARKRLKRKARAKDQLMFLKTCLFSGTWHGILIRVASMMTGIPPRWQ